MRNSDIRFETRISNMAIFGVERLLSRAQQIAQQDNWEKEDRRQIKDLAKSAYDLVELSMQLDKDIFYTKGKN